MEDRSALLHQLRIDRGAAPVRGGEGGGIGKWIVLGIVLLALLAGGIYLLMRPTGVPVTVAIARTATTGGAATAGTSLLDASGYVVARRAATVSAKITGKVTEVLIEEGSRVEAGQIVARLDDTNIRAELAQSKAQVEASRAQLAQVRVSLANAERDLKRKSGLVGEHLISVADLDTSQTALDGLRAQLITAQRNVEVSQATLDVTQRSYDDTTVRAPFAGVITVKAAQVGEIVSPLSAGGGFTRTGIGTVVDMDSLEVEVDVNENFINRVKDAMPARVRLNAYPDWDIPAYVIAVIPTADRSKATVKVRVGFKERDARILPEMGARVAFLAEAPAATEGAKPAATGVVLPAAAIDAGSNGADTGVVWLIHGDTVERRAVKLGGTVRNAEGGDGRIVQSGLANGDRVAVGDFSKLADGTQIRINDTK
jgi:RND family efflux transporter MFP subunit